MAEDANKFALRELRRGNRYHLVLLDPPDHGRGPKGERWDFAHDIAPLLSNCFGLLESKVNCGLVLSAYAIEFSLLGLRNLFPLHRGTLEAGELTLPEGDGGRLLPCGYALRWRSQAK